MPSPAAHTRSISIEMATLTPSLNGTTSVYDIHSKVELYPFPKRKWGHQSPQIVRHRHDRRNEYQSGNNFSSVFAIAGFATGYVLIFFFVGLFEQYPSLKKLFKPAVALKSNQLVQSTPPSSRKLEPKVTASPTPATNTKLKQKTALELGTSEGFFLNTID
jgi:hypothetical protein